MDNEEDKEPKVGAPFGNTNSNKNNRIWANTIRKLAIQEDYKRIHVIAEKLFEKAAEGDLGAMKEVGDRLDGKAIAVQEITGADGKDLPIGIGISFVKPDDSPVPE
jgi:hypothetical protein